MEEERADHIKMVITRKFEKRSMKEDEYKNNGRPKGSGEKKDMKWRIKNPLGKKIDCYKDTGL